jgi:hypothetical protein
MQTNNEHGDGGAQAPCAAARVLARTHIFTVGGETFGVGFDLLGDPDGIVYRVGAGWFSTRPGLVLAKFAGLRLLRGQVATLSGAVDHHVLRVVKGVDAFIAWTAADPYVATIGVSSWDLDLRGIAPVGWAVEVDPALGVER